MFPSLLLAIVLGGAKMLHLLMIASLCSVGADEKPIIQPSPGKVSAADAAEPPLAALKFEEVKVFPGRRTVDITVTTEGAIVDWEMPEQVGDYLPVNPADVSSSADGKTIKIPVPAKPGKYTFRAYTAIKNRAAFGKFTLVVGDSPDKPDIPPADAFVAEIQSLFVPSVKTKSLAQQLASSYRIAAREAKNLENTTFNELFDLISASIELIEDLGEDGLKTIRTRVKAELTGKIPDLSAGLTEKSRDAAASVYSRAALALELCAK